MTEKEGEQVMYANDDTSKSNRIHSREKEGEKKNPLTREEDQGITFVQLKYRSLGFEYTSGNLNEIESWKKRS